MPKVLIVGRGVLPLLVAILAEKQGYESVVVYEDLPLIPAALVGGLPGLPLNSFFDVTGFPLEDPRFFHPLSPAIVFLGKKWQLAGMPELRSGFSSMERSQESLFPRIFSGMKNEMVRFFRRKGVGGHIETWWNNYLFRRNDRLLEKVLSALPAELSEWKDFLDSLGLFLGLSPDESNPVYRIRALACLLNAWTFYPEMDSLSREVSKSVRKGLHFSVRSWNRTPLVVTQDRKRRGIVLETEKGSEIFDRMLDLTNDLGGGRDPERWIWTVPSALVPDVWPMQCLVPSLKDQPAILLQGRLRDDKICFAVSSCKKEKTTPLQKMQQSLDSLLISGSSGNECSQLEPVAIPDSMVHLEELKSHVWRKRSPYLHTRGPCYRLMDPTRLPFLTDDWVRQLFYTLMQR
jgi:hypothetical protein